MPVRTFCGAVLGIVMSGYVSGGDRPAEMGAALDAAMAQLEAGLLL